VDVSPSENFWSCLRRILARVRARSTYTLLEKSCILLKMLVLRGL
jgi:hypothetical protein